MSRLSVGNLCQLDLLNTTAGQREQYRQRFFFSDSEVLITDSGIEVTSLVGPVWEDNLIKRQFERIPIFRSFAPDGAGGFNIQLTDAGEECEFLRYLINTSNHWGRATLNSTQSRELSKHLANKITCLGYLLRDLKYLNETKAVVAMDAAMSEVGTSRGRTGKSLIGKAIAQFVTQSEIDGRNLTNDDPYMFSGVTPTTKNIFIDDVNENFNIGRFYQRLTGRLNVNIKQGARFYIDFEQAPKFYITTNHALSGLDDSANARLIFMSFSDWYNLSHSPYQEFGHNFFTDWDERQWSLFDNLMAECVMYYMRSREKGWSTPGHGAIDPPMGDLKIRELRQEMGELFLSWAEIYFSPDGGHLNTRIVRKEMYQAFLNEFGIKSTQITSKGFRDKIYAYCRFTGLHFNAHRPSKDGVWFHDHIRRCPDETFIGDRDLSCSLEFYTISTTDYSRQTGK